MIPPEGSMLQLYLRHGLPEESRFVYGLSDVMLGDEGRVQIRQVGNHIAGLGIVIEALVMSPWLRVKQSVAELGKDLPLPKVVSFDEDLRDVNPSSLTGQEVSVLGDLEAEGQDMYTAGFATETKDQIAQRGFRAVRRAVREIPARITLIGGHGDTLAFALHVIQQRRGVLAGESVLSIPSPRQLLSEGRYLQRGDMAATILDKQGNLLAITYNIVQGDWIDVDGQIIPKAQVQNLLNSFKP